MTDFATLHAADVAPVIAPDGSTARPLLRLPAASALRFELAAGAISRAVAHRSVSEIWYVQDGAGELGAGRTNERRSPRSRPEPARRFRSGRISSFARPAIEGSC